jgi:hypothetical protein
MGSVAGAQEGGAVLTRCHRNTFWSPSSGPNSCLGNRARVLWEDSCLSSCPFWLGRGDRRGEPAASNNRKHFSLCLCRLSRGLGQQIDVPNYTWLEQILNTFLVLRAHNSGWWGRCQEACWVAEDDNLGCEIPTRDESGQSEA